MSWRWRRMTWCPSAAVFNRAHYPHCRLILELSAKFPKHCFGASGGKVVCCVAPSKVAAAKALQRAAAVPIWKPSGEREDEEESSNDGIREIWERDPYRSSDLKSFLLLQLWSSVRSVVPLCLPKSQFLCQYFFFLFLLLDLRFSFFIKH